MGMSLRFVEGFQGMQESMGCFPGRLMLLQCLHPLFGNGYNLPLIINMALPLTISDFTLRQATCELKYPDAFLVFDRTGIIYHHLTKRFKNVKNVSASPFQTHMTAEEGTIAVEGQALRLTDNEADSKLERFAANFKVLFDSAVENLELSVFTRVGLRLIFVKKYDNADQPKAEINALQLLKIGSDKRFGIGPEITELHFRWENKELGASVRLRAESGSVDAKLPPELGLAEKAIHKEFHHLIIDVDYYTVALVEREQWDPITWITQSARIVRKEIDRILSL
jgi:hypothetical protein